nr:reverse transcriptase domain-containing protein [Tanacetum cinerariifolium]
MANILQNHPLKFHIAASSSVPWCYLGQFWHIQKEDGSKYKLKFVLDRKELTLTLDDFKSIFQLPLATNNNHEHFVAAPKFLEMVKEYQEKDKIGSKPDKNEKRAARRWLVKEPPRSITTWDDLVSKFINEFFPPSRTTNLRNEISNFQQKFDESFHEAWERYKDLLRACPHHGFTKLHQLDTFYNALSP